MTAAGTMTVDGMAGMAGMADIEVIGTASS
jgi:hypothetical protein